MPEGVRILRAELLWRDEPPWMDTPPLSPFMEEGLMGEGVADRELSPAEGEMVDLAAQGAEPGRGLTMLPRPG
jgi:hypothetical protein